MRTFSFFALLLSTFASITCNASSKSDNLLELKLQPTSARSSQYFDFGTGDFDIKVDNKGILIRQDDGSMKPMIPVMGEIHPTRVNEEDWATELQKMKEGGLTIISCYLFWSHHEPEEGHFNWTGNHNIRKFVELCGSMDLQVILRIGPWCHGECYLGGLPDWLVADTTIHVRSTDPKFMKPVGRLYREISKQVEGLYGCSAQSPIIGVQIENECGGNRWPYMMALKDSAMACGILPPFYTRTGWPVVQNATFGEMLPLYGDYADGFWDRKLTDMPGGYPDAFTFRESRLSNVIATEVFGTNQSRKMEGSDLSYPYFTCELGGGMMPSYARRINIFGHEAVSLAVCKVGSGSNLPGYYMYHGGTNPLHPEHSMAEMTDSRVTNYNDLPYRSYDFQAPVGEVGQVNPVSYYELRRFHKFLAHWGEELSNYDPIFPETNSEDGRKDSHLRYTVRTDGKRGFVFINNYTRMMPMSEKKEIQWSLTRTDGSKLGFPSKPINIADEVVCWFPFGLDCQGVTLDYATAMPYDIEQSGKTTTYTLAAVPGVPVELSINGKLHRMKSNDKLKVRNKAGNDIVFIILDDATSLKPLPQYTLIEDKNAKVSLNQLSEAKGLREYYISKQGVIAQPTEKDFDKAAVWELQLDQITDQEQAILEIQYKGDVARLYCYDELVMDNFWNGKPMLVRVRDLKHHKLTLKILPMGNDYPIYLQKEQRELREEGVSVEKVRILMTK